MPDDLRQQLEALEALEAAQEDHATVLLHLKNMAYVYYHETLPTLQAHWYALAHQDDWANLPAA